MVILLIGTYSPEHTEMIERALGRASTRDVEQKILFIEELINARKRLDDSSSESVGCVFIDNPSSEVAGFVSWMRGRAHLFSVPVFVLVSHICDQAFQEAHALGADDAIDGHDMGAFTRRVAILQNYSAWDRPPISQGKCIIAHPERQQRSLYGRTLRNAGFDIHFAIDKNELDKHISSQQTPQIVIISYSLISDDLCETVLRIRAKASNSRLPIIFIGEGREFSDVVDEVLPTDAVELMSNSAPPDDLLFITNELLRGVTIEGKDDQRASVRLLYGALCAFRTAGELSPVYGYCYNISYEGMYVKTFDPPRRDTELWIELVPPFEMNAIHLRGKVIWSRFPDNSKAVTVPPGFGLWIDFSACPPHDLKSYQEAYKQLLHQYRFCFSVEK